jgi:hypothetical protein
MISVVDPQNDIRVLFVAPQLLPFVNLAAMAAFVAADEIR